MVDPLRIHLYRVSGMWEVSTWQKTPHTKFQILDPFGLRPMDQNVKKFCSILWPWPHLKKKNSGQELLILSKLFRRNTIQMEIEPPKTKVKFGKSSQKSLAVYFFLSIPKATFFEKFNFPLNNF